MKPWKHDKGGSRENPAAALAGVAWPLWAGCACVCVCGDYATRTKEAPLSQLME